MNRRIGICLVGAGRAGMIHGRNFASNVVGAYVAAVVDADEQQARSAAMELGTEKWYTDYKKAFENPAVDATVIVTPTKYHREAVICAANAGKHIFCEKPMAMTAEECDDMITAVEENRVKLQIGFMRRFDKNFRRAKELAASGKIGDIVMIKSLTHGPSTPKEWMYDIEKSNGPLAEVCSHDIDTVRWLSGSEVDSVYAIGGNYRCRNISEMYPDFYDTVLVNMKMKNGVICSIDGAQGVGYGYDARVEILGTSGLIRLGDLADKSVITYTKNDGMSGDVVKSWMNLFEDAYLEEDRSFVRCILEDIRPEITGFDGKMAIEIVRAGNESLKNGAIVFLEGGTLI